MRADRNLSAGTNLQGHATTGRRITGLATAVAPPAVVQAAAFNYGATPQTVTFPSPVTSGNLLVAAIGNDNFGAGSVTDSQNNSWAAAVTSPSGHIFSVSVWWAMAGAGSADTITVHTTNGAQAAGQIYEISGIGSHTPIDQTGTSFADSDAPIVGPNLSGLAGATDFVVYWAFYNHPGTTPVGGIWTSDYSALISGSHFFGACYADTGPTVTGPTLTPGLNATFVCVGAAFHP